MSLNVRSSLAVPLRFALALLVLAPLAAAPLLAQNPSRPDSAAFITRLGRDTLVVERFVRTANSVEADVVMRTPTTTHTRYTLQLGPEGQVTRMEAVTTDPRKDGATVRHELVTRVGDSLRIEVRTDTQQRSTTTAAAATTLPFIDMVHWPFELVLMRARAVSTDKITQPLLTGTRVADFPIGRHGADSMSITHPFRGTMQTRVDAQGRLLSLDAGATTRKLIVERTTWMPLEPIAAAWAAQDAAGRSAGALSGRAENTATVGGGTLHVDYGTPMKRGREIWGALVPYGQLWRTGANEATHFTTDRPVVLGSGSDTLALPAGRYTLFSVPEANGGHLIVNAQTGQNGNSYDASRDIGRVRMTTRQLAEPVETFTIALEDGNAAAIRLQWDRREYVVPVRVSAR